MYESFIGHSYDLYQLGQGGKKIFKDKIKIKNN
jgi:hypothetical protein